MHSSILLLAFSAGSAWALDSCAKSSPSNFLGTLPRINRKFSSVDLAAMQPVVAPCNSDPTQICTSPTLDPVDGAAEYWIAGDFTDDPSSWFNYVDSLVVWAAFGVTLALMVIICGCGFCCGRRCGLCGSTYPTIEGSEYSKKSKGVTYVLLVSFVVMMVVCVFVGEFSGNRALTAAQHTMVQSPADGVLGLVSGVEAPLHTLMASLVGETLVSTVQTLKETITTEVDLVAVHESFGCVQSLVDVASPEALTFFSDTIKGLSSSLDALPEQAATESLLLGLKATTDNAGPATQAAASLLDTLGTSLSSLNSALDGLAPELASLSSSISTTVVPKLQSLKGVVEPLADGSGAPSASEVTNLIAETQALIDASGADGASALATAYGAMHAKLNEMTDPSELSTLLSDTKSALDGQKSSVHGATAKLEAVAAAEKGVPSIPTMNATLNVLLGVIESFAPAEIRAALLKIDGAVDSLPETTEIATRTESLKSIGDHTSCIAELSVQLKKVNETLIELPPGLSSVDEQLKQINESASGVVGQLGNLTDFVDNLNVTISGVKNDLNIDDYVSKLDELSESTGEAKDAVVGLQGNLTGLEKGMGSEKTNVTALAQDAKTLGNELDGSTISATDDELTKLQEASETRKDALEKVKAAQDGLALMPAACAVGEAACNTAKNVLRESLTYLEQLKSALESLPASRILSAVNEGLAKAEEAKAALAELDVSEINKLQSSVAETLSQVAGEKDGVEGMRSAIDSTVADLNIDGLIDDWKKLGESLRGPGTDLNKYADAIKSANESVASATSGDIKGALDMEKRIYKLIFTDLDILLAPLLKTNLENELKNDGIRSTARLVAKSLDSIYAAAMPETDTSTSVLGPASRTPVNDILDEAGADVLLDAVDLLTSYSDAGSAKDGAMHFLLTLVATASNSTKPKEAKDFAQYAKPLVFGHVENGKILSYPSTSGGNNDNDPEFGGGQGGAGLDSMCFTKSCFENTVTHLNQESLQAEIGVPLSRELAMGLPFVVPGLLALVCLLVFVTPRAAMPFAGCVGVALPFVLIIAGAVLWPLLLGVADTCAVSEPALVSAVASASPALCKGALGGEYSDATGTCLLEVHWANMTIGAPSPDAKNAGSTELRVPFGEIVKSVVQDCAGSLDGAEPINALVEAVRASAQDIAKGRVDELAEGVGGGVLRPRLKRDVTATADKLAANLAELVKGLGGTFGCANLYAAYAGGKDSFCCGGVGALYWFVGAWYMIGLSMCCCGVPGGILAHKRLRSPEQIELWKARHDVERRLQRKGSARMGEERRSSAMGRDYYPDPEPRSTFSVSNPMPAAANGQVGVPLAVPMDEEAGVELSSIVLADDGTPLQGRAKKKLQMGGGETRLAAYSGLDSWGADKKKYQSNEFV